MFVQLSHTPTRNLICKTFSAAIAMTVWCWPWRIAAAALARAGSRAEQPASLARPTRLRWR
eukprot:3041696-Pyramimonas_sp.AAC.1